MRFDLVIIACGQRKIWADAPWLGVVEAGKVYTGGYFLQNKAFAEREGERWLTLSAKYGLQSPVTRSKTTMSPSRGLTPIRFGATGCVSKSWPVDQCESGRAGRLPFWEAASIRLLRDTPWLDWTSL